MFITLAEVYSSARIINVSSARVPLPPQQGFTTYIEVDRPMVINRTFESLMSIITLDIEYPHPSTINVYSPGGGVPVWSESGLHDIWHSVACDTTSSD